MTNACDEGIVFDKIFFKSILKRAEHEGYLKHYHTDPSFQNPFKLEEITYGTTKTALQMLLLYEKAYYPDPYFNYLEKPILNLYFDLIENSALSELIELPPFPEGAFNINPKISDFIKDSYAINELIISNKRRVKKIFNPFDSSNQNYSYEYYTHKFDSMLKILNIISDKKDTITSIYAEQLVGFPGENLSNFLKHRYNVKSSKLNYLCSPFNNNTELFYATITNIESEVRHINNLFDYSSEYSVPILTDIISKSIPSKKRKFFWEQIMSSKNEMNELNRVKDAEYDQIALGIFFSKNLRPVLPVINSINDIIRLRGEHNIKDFRNKIFEWKIGLKEGDVNLHQIEKEMIEANKKLKTLGNCERVGTWITYISLPLEIALTLSGLPTSFITSIPSFGVACTSKLLKKNYN